MYPCFFSGKILPGTLRCAVAIAFMVIGRAVAQEIVLFEEHFDDDDWSSRGWYDGPDMVLDRVNRVGDSGGSAVFTWPAQGATTANSKGARVKFDPVEGFTMSCYMKFSDNWEWTGLGWHPHLNLFMTNKNGDFDGPAHTHLTLYVEVVDGVPKLLVQDGQNIDQSRVGENLVGITENRSVAGGNGDPDGHGGSAYLYNGYYRNNKYWSADTIFFGDEQGSYYKNDWHKVVAHFQLNSIIDGIGVANGVLQLWVDDSLLIDHHDVMFRTGQNPGMKIDQYLLLPYYGPGVPHSQSFWIDEIKIIRDEQELPAVPPPVQSFLLFEENFDDADWASRGWYDGPGMVVDPGAGAGDSGGATVFNWLAQGDKSPGASGGRKLLDAAQGLTVSYDIKFSDNWSFAVDSLFPPALFWFVTGEDGQWANPVTSRLTVFLDHLDGGINIGMRDILNIDTLRLGEDLTGETENRAVAGGNGNSDSHRAIYFTRAGDEALFNLKHLKSDTVYFRDDQGGYYKGDWHHVESHFQLNTIVDGKGVANGVARSKFDGKLVMDYSDVMYRTGQYPDMKFNQLMLLPYLPGGAPQPQSLWIDNLLIEKEERELLVPQQLSCDFNGDGSSNILDVLGMVLLGRANPDANVLDRDGDGAYSLLDVLALLRDIVEGKCN